VNAERWRQVDTILKEALERKPGDQATFLDSACSSDLSLRGEVEALIRVYEQAGSFLEARTSGPDTNETITRVAVSLVGQTLGHYAVKRLLGSGGMGEVYLAEDRRLGRPVAIKLLPAEFTADAERVRRFAQEARAASALNHPNIITIHEIGEREQTRYIVTEYVEGQTLRQHLDCGRMKLGEALDVAIQVATALDAAHCAGIVHRDIKPENVMVRPDRYVKVLDFGLAKLLEPSIPAQGVARQFEAGVHTETGLVMGTPRCMSPEQARGEKADARTDLFSFGVMLYEMVAGRAPFTGATPTDVIAAILKDAPPPLAEFAPDTSLELQQIIDKTLQKNREERYQTASELLADLKPLKRELDLKDELASTGQPGAGAAAGGKDETAQPDRVPNQAGSPSDVGAALAMAKRVAGSAQRRKVLVVGVLALTVAGAGWFYWRSAKVGRAQAALPRIEELARAERFFAAYDLAIQAQRYLPNHPTLTRLLRTIADDLTVVTDPPGAQVYLKRFVSDESGRLPARQLVGTTPINHQQIARGAYVVSIERDGYASLDRTVSGALLRLGGMLVPSPPIRLEAKLVEAANVPARMAFVPGGDYRLVGWSRPTAERVRLDAYLIDKYEVTNREYKEFINARGYLDRTFWQHKFIKDGRELSWEEALREFKDQTGLPGPRTWRNQEIPEGKGEHPVVDLTWYEAAAYAAFRGKDLPTVFQWEKAARNALTMDAGVIMPWGLFTGDEAVERRANFGGRGTLPVESLEFGLSPFGCYHMAGNVAEWCRNQSDKGFATTGGSWGDPPYQFGNYGAFPGSYSSGKLGFRCVRNAPGVTANQGAMPLHADAGVPVYKPPGEASFRAWQQQYYRYEQPPLDAQIVEVKETEDWRREKITYVGAEGERAIAYLYLPKQYAPPWQVIQFIPPVDTFLGLTRIEARVEAYLPAFIKSGRAMLAVVLKGFPERPWPPNRRPPAVSTVEYRVLVLDWMTDERRALDYVATRNDLDPSRVAYLAISSDSSLKLGLPAVEPRYRAVIWQGACLRAGDAQVLPEIHPANLLPYIRASKLFVHGRYDEGCRLTSETEPLVKLLREPKRLVYYEGGHIAPLELMLPTISNWLDETMGPVNRR
jgi:serine/threonine protein kinase/formylglycine-generating enzyme required for sulfatase activity